MEKITYKNVKEMKSGEIQTVEVFADKKESATIVADLINSPINADDLYAWISDPDTENRDQTLYQDKVCLVIYQTIPDKFGMTNQVIHQFLIVKQL